MNTHHRDAKSTPRTIAFYSDLTAMLKTSYSVLSSDIRELMTRHGYREGTSVEAMIAHLPFDCPVWSERDDENLHLTWYHLSRPEDGEIRRKRRVPKMSQPLKQPEEKRGDEESKKVRVSDATIRRLKHYLADHPGMTQQECADAALHEWLERRAA